MSYELEAYLVPMMALEAMQNRSVLRYLVPMMAREAKQNLSALRNVYHLTDELGLVPLCGTVHLDKAWPLRASKGTTIAKISADYFGGNGSQSATVWTDGQIVADDVDVNTALHLLGVQKTDGDDEWDRVGLGRYRRTETWAAEAIRANRKLADDPLEALLTALRYTSPNRKQQEKVRSGAARDLGELGDEAAIPDLVEAIKTKDEEGLRIGAAAALAKIGGPGLIALAEQLHEEESPLNSERSSFRFFAIIHALGEAGPAAAPFTDDLAIKLRHREESTRRDAAEALGKIGSAAANAVPALIEALRDEEYAIRAAAAQALGEIGPAAQAAAEALSICLRDQEATVRYSAEKAMAAINESPERH